MKKLIVVALAVVGGGLLFRKVRSDKSGSEPWAEATDEV